MPELSEVIDTFPDTPSMFTWDVKVHMLMPRQYPCIPDWHVDNVPRVAGVQQFDKVRPDLPMYLWLSNGPLTEFVNGYVTPRQWLRFTQEDVHRGTAAGEFGWRLFIRATHQEIMPPKLWPTYEGYLRRHTQVYLDAKDYQW